MRDFAAETVHELDRVKALPDFCKEWTSKWRGIAVAAQGILNVFFPPGAKVLGFLIGIADSFCAGKP